MAIDEIWDSRTRSLLGDEAMRKLRDAHVLVVGLGGVGGYAAEMLLRSGVGHLTLVDADDVDPTNLNRQIIALRSGIGRPKTDLFAERFADINPRAEIHPLTRFLEADKVEEIVDRRFDFVIDAIDTVAPKVALIAFCLRNAIPVISSMGAGGRVDVSAVCYSDLWKTREDGLARAVRQRLKKMGLKRSLKVVCSNEAPASSALIHIDSRNKQTSLGTLGTVPSTFGIFLANHVILNIIK